MDDQMVAEGGVYHRSCLKCTECHCQLTLLNFASIKGTLYCKPHFIELFKRE
jgi:cysteine/glycine-rich protein